MTDPNDAFREDLAKLATAIMPFGKFKGRAIADLTGNYLAWFAREGFPPGDSAACWLSCSSSTITAFAVSSIPSARHRRVHSACHGADLVIPRGQAKLTD